MDSKHIHAALRLGLKKGANQLEIFILGGLTDTIQMEKNAIKTSEGKSLSGIGVRAYTNKGLGIAATTLLTPQSLEEITLKAVKLSKLSPPDELFHSLPGPFSSYPKVEGLFDSSIESLTGDDLTDMAIQTIDAALEKHNNVIVSGTLERDIFVEEIYNSLGLEAKQRISLLSGAIYAKAEQDGDIATSWDYQKTRQASIFNPSVVGGNAADGAVSLLGAKKIKPCELPLILDQRSVYDTFSSILGSGLNAYAVLLGTAFFKERLGNKITNEQITILDNPLHPFGANSAIFDDEGVPHQRLILVKKGRAITYFSNSYTAAALDIPNTGHASKENLGDIPYPDLTQLQFDPGDWSIEEIIRETKKGIYVKDTALEPISNSPNISILVDQGFMIENGELTYPLKETMVGTNVYALLQNIDAVSKELLNEEGSIAPIVRISTASISSGR